jgi:CHAT domain-containing protein
MADLDLSGVDLAVLSACETGLGKLESGEGVLGLQRALQVSGARTVVGTLWQIPDQPTRVLMENFYRNLWDKKLSKLEALRQAQLWMLREGKRDAGVQRGLEAVNEAEPDQSGRLPPFYWAAFVLSGDWR